MLQLPPPINLTLSQMISATEESNLWSQRRCSTHPGLGLGCVSWIDIASAGDTDKGTCHRVAKFPELSSITVSELSFDTHIRGRLAAERCLRRGPICIESQSLVSIVVKKLSTAFISHLHSRSDSTVDKLGTGICCTGLKQHTLRTCGYIN